MAEQQRSRAADPAAAVLFSGKTNGSEYSTRPRQVYDESGIPLPARRPCSIPVAPRLAQPAVWRWAAADRWLEVAL